MAQSAAAIMIRAEIGGFACIILVCASLVGMVGVMLLAEAGVNTGVVGECVFASPMLAFLLSITVCEVTDTRTRKQNKQN